jgi:hypothetical protein
MTAIERHHHTHAALPQDREGIAVRKKRYAVTLLMSRGRWSVRGTMESAHGGMPRALRLSQHNPPALLCRCWQAFMALGVAEEADKWGDIYDVAMR